MTKIPVRAADTDEPSEDGSILNRGQYISTQGTEETFIQNSSLGSGCSQDLEIYWQIEDTCGADRSSVTSKTPGDESLLTCEEDEAVEE